MNIYEEHDGYTVGYTKKGYEFYFDIEDYKYNDIKKLRQNI